MYTGIRQQAPDSAYLFMKKYASNAFRTFANDLSKHVSSLSVSLLCGPPLGNALNEHTKANCLYIYH